MKYVVVGLGIVGSLPLILAWHANRRTSLRDAWLWVGAAWLGWGAHFFAYYGADRNDLRFWALALSGCCAVVVLGARRPHVGAWNLVVLGLLAVLSLPLLQEWFLGIGSLDLVRSLLLPATLVVGVLNYLPTRMAALAFVLGVAWGAELLLDHEAAPSAFTIWRHLGLIILLSPWLGWWAWRQGRQGTSEFDWVWLRFRDRFGLLWGQRVREHFNTAAHNAGWQVFLSWRGLRVAEGAITEEMTQALRALLKRFEAEAPSFSPARRR